MIAQRGWDISGGHCNMGMIQIVGLLAIIGLVVTLVVLRKRDNAGVSKTKTTSRI
jgi:hypothetical protein